MIRQEQVHKLGSLTKMEFVVKPLQSQKMARNYHLHYIPKVQNPEYHEVKVYIVETDKISLTSK